MSGKPVYKMDLSKTDKEGAFPCKGCGTIIRPEDESGTTYKVSTRMKDNKLEAIIFDCKKCGSITELTDLSKYPQ